MRMLLVAAMVAALIVGCGGKSKPLAETARPCLAKLGRYVHHVARPIRPTNTVAPLPLIDPDYKPTPDRPTQQLGWTDDVEEYGEVSFDSSGAGANAVQILIFRQDPLPKRVMAATKRAQRRAAQTNPVPSGFLVTRGLPTLRDRTIVIWSSVPTAQQKRGVYGCLNA
jgi:hypothetical protein